MIDTEEKIRLDKWLWAARFFKTRSLASQAVQGGKVHVNNSRAKPSRIVVPGDILTIRKSSISFTVTVLATAKYRRPAVEAQTLYEESAESIKEREEQRALSRLIRAPGSAPEKKPGKRDRRKIREFIRKQ